MIFVSDFSGTSIGSKKGFFIVFPWYFHGIPVGFLLDLHEAFMGSPRIFVIVLGDFFGIPAGIPCYFYWISMTVLWGCYGGSIRFLWDFHCMSMTFLWDFYWISMVVLWNFIRTSQGCLWDSYRISIGFSGDFFGISMAFL